HRPGRSDGPEQERDEATCSVDPLALPLRERRKSRDALERCSGSWRERPIPHSGVMGAGVAQDGQMFEPSDQRMGSLGLRSLVLGQMRQIDMDYEALGYRPLLAHLILR